MNNAAKVLIV